MKKVPFYTFPLLFPFYLHLPSLYPHFLLFFPSFLLPNFLSFPILFFFSFSASSASISSTRLCNFHFLSLFLFISSIISSIYFLPFPISSLLLFFSFSSSASISGTRLCNFNKKGSRAPSCIIQALSVWRRVAHRAIP